MSWRNMFPLCCLVLLSCDLPYVGLSLSLNDGTSLQIPLGFQTQDPPFLVLWKKEGALKGRIRRGQCTYGCSETSYVFSNGSLFLERVRRDDEGTYMADVYDKSGVLVHHAEILLQVVDVFTDHVIDLNLESTSSDHPKQVVWSKGEEEKADEGIYSARTLNSSLSPILYSGIFLYVNVSDVGTNSDDGSTDGRTDGSSSKSSILFISIISISCLGVLTFITLGRFLRKKGKMEKTDGNSSVSYTEIRRKSTRNTAERSSPSNVTGPWAEMGGNKEEPGEVGTVFTFQCTEI
ncbi:uncharacterized protein ACNLHF_009818 isoform 2-T2 [Anomaloglossus baeobatrachus]